MSIENAEATDDVEGITSQLGEMQLEMNSYCDDLLSKNILDEVISQLVAMELCRDGECNVCKVGEQPKNEHESCPVENTAKPTKPKLATEDTGKVFEKAICITYGIEFVGPYKYGDARPNAILPLINNLPSLFPPCVHSAEKGSPYDFTSLDGKWHLSAKSCKRGKAKVAPQVYGQCSVAKLWNKMGWELVDDPVSRRQMVYENILDLLHLFEEHTFSCDTVYYNQRTQTVKFIKRVKPINWGNEVLTWTKHWRNWKGSSTLKAVRNDKTIALIEIQFHSKGRSNMCNRWVLENLLELFPESFEVSSCCKEEQTQEQTQE